MKRIAKKSTLIQDLARKVGYAAGRVVATTQELAESAAMCRHVLPCLSLAVKLAPCSTRLRTGSAYPWNAAKWSGVRPSGPVLHSFIN